MTRALLTPTLIALLTAAVAQADPARTDLWSAVAARDTALVSDLLAHGADVDSADASGNTILMWAAACDYPEVVAILVDAGADVNARGRIGNTALIHAAQVGALEAGRILLTAGARADVANDYGSDARGLAVGYGHADLVDAIDAAPAPVHSGAPVALAF
jgi:hypothetical protein